MSYIKCRYEAGEYEDVIGLINRTPQRAVSVLQPNRPGANVAAIGHILKMKKTKG